MRSPWEVYSLGYSRIARRAANAGHDRSPWEVYSLGYGRYVPNTTVPHVDPQTARSTMRAVGHAIRSGIVQSCHDLSEGGLAIAAAEMSLAGLLGLSIDIDQVPHVPRELINLSPDMRDTILLFSESASRFLVEVSPEQKETFEAHMRAHDVEAVACIGSVTTTDHFEVRSGEQLLIDLAVSDLQAAWKGEQA